MSVSWKLVYFLAVQAVRVTFTTADGKTRDVCSHDHDKFTAGIGRRGFLKLDKNFSLDIVNLLVPKDYKQCQTVVSPNCFQCQASLSIFCNATSSQDAKYLKSANPISRLHLDLEYIDETSFELFDELNVVILELEEGNMTSSKFSILQRIQNLSTLVVKGKLQMAQNTNIFLNLENLTALIVDFSSNCKDEDQHDIITGPPQLAQESGEIEGNRRPDPEGKPMIPDGIGDPEYNKHKEIPEIQDDPDGPNYHIRPDIGENETPTNSFDGREYNQSVDMGTIENLRYSRISETPKSLSTFGIGGKNKILPNLRVFGLVSGMATEKEYIFIKDSPIEYLYFMGCTINAKNLTEILSGLKNSIKFLDIHDSTFINDGDDIEEVIDQIALHNIVFTIMSSINGNTLRGFSLTEMGLKYIPYDALEVTQDSLQYLSLGKNDFRNLRNTYNNFSNHYIDFDGRPGRILPQMPQLLELDLSDCQIQSLESDVFANLPNLKVLLLAYNLVLSFHPDSFRHLNDLQFLDISQIGNTQSGVQNVNFTNTPSLKILDLSQTKLPSNFKFIGELKSLKKLSLCNSFDYLNDIDSELFETMTNLESLTLSGNEAQHGSIGRKHFSKLENLKELYLVRCSLISLGIDQTNTSLSNTHPFRNLKSLKLLDLSENTLSFINEIYFAPLSKLELVLLKNNNIINWEAPVFSNLTYLREINVKNNFLTSMSVGMVQDFSHVQKFSILGNKFECGCDIKNFVRTVNGKVLNKTMFVEGWVENMNLCTDVTNSVRVPFQKFTDSKCTMNSYEPNTGNNTNGNTYVVYFIVAISIIFLTIATVFTYIKWRDIKFFALIIKNATILSFYSDETDPERKCKLCHYDVFISYSDSNRNWVLDEMLPNLEAKSNVKVCLHERDFQVGLSILENIISCMDQSKCIMLIISLPFVKSNWCQFELHLAQHRLLETKRESLILVLLEDIPRSKRSTMLNYLMKTKTYIVWPPCAEDHEARKFFWKRIYQAVVLEKNKSKSVSFA